MNKVSLVSYDPRKIADILSNRLMPGIVPDNIANPKSDVVKMIYYNFVNKAIGVSEVALTTLPMSANSDYDEVRHGSSVPLLIIFSIMKAFINDITMEKVTLQMCDLVQPHINVPRFRMLMTILADYLVLNELNAPIFEEISDEFADKKNEVNVIQDQLVEAEKLKTELAAGQAARKRRENELLCELRKAEESLDRVIVEYSAVNSEIGEMNAKIEQAKADGDKLASEIDSNEKMVQHLSAELITSPHRCKQEMAEKKEQIELLRKNLIETRQALDNKKHELQICEEARAHLPLVESLINDVFAKKAEINEWANLLSEKERSVEELEQEYGFNQKKHESMLLQLAETKRTHETLQKEHVNRIATIHSNCEAIAQKIDEIKRNSSSNNVQPKKQELIRIRNAQIEMEKRKKQEAQDLVAKFQMFINIYNENKSAYEDQLAVFGQFLKKGAQSCTNV